jgi:hypothetical protein
MDGATKRKTGVEENCGRKRTRSSTVAAAAAVAATAAPAAAASPAAVPAAGSNTVPAGGGEEHFTHPSEQKRAKLQDKAFEKQQKTCNFSCKRELRARMPHGLLLGDKVTC